MPAPCGRGRGIARGAWRGCAAARRRAKPGAVAQLPPGTARGSGRSQPHRDAQPHQGVRRRALHRCHGPPGCRRGRSGRGERLAAADRGHRPHRSSPDSQPRYCRRQPRPQRSGGRAAGGDAGARCRNDPLRAHRDSASIAAGDFFAGTMETALAPDELLTEIRVPALPEGTGWGFQEAARRQGDFALVAVAILLRPSDDGAGGLNARVVVTGTGDGPVRMRSAEAVLTERGTRRRSRARRWATPRPRPAMRRTTPTRPPGTGRKLVSALTRRACREAAMRMGHSKWLTTSAACA